MKHIHIISPSGAIYNILIDHAIVRLEQWGYSVSVAPHARGRYGRFASTEQERLSDLNDALCQTDTDIILCSRGGYGLQQIADHLRVPEKRVPLLVGFSDITVLHNILGLHGVPTLHASMCKYIATLPDEHPALQLLQRALQGETMAYSLPPQPHQREGECEGRLIGGNLSVLYGLQGTPYSLNCLIDKCEEPPILFIEDVCERHYHIDRMMQNLRMSGVLARLGGLVVGLFTDCDDDPLMGCTVYETILRAVTEYDFPVMVNLPAGHVEQNVPLRLNTKWHLAVSANGAQLTECTAYNSHRN